MNENEKRKMVSRRRRMKLRIGVNRIRRNYKRIKGRNEGRGSG